MKRLDMVTVAKVNGRVRTTELDAMEREYKIACAGAGGGIGQ